MPKEEDGSEKQLVLLTQTLFGRITHWLTVFLLTIGLLTGLYMTNPQIFWTMRTIRLLHLTSNTLLAAVLLVRVYYAYLSGDYKNFTFHRGDGKRLRDLMAYYLFFRRTKPYEPTKYNVAQRMIYVSWLFGFIFQTITGLLLANPTAALQIQRLFGGLQTIRLMRYLVAVYFAITIITHIYLGVTSDPAKFQAIFTGYVRVKNGKADK